MAFPISKFVKKHKGHLRWQRMVALEPLFLLLPLSHPLHALVSVVVAVVVQTDPRLTAGIAVARRIGEVCFKSLSRRVLTISLSRAGVNELPDKAGHIAVVSSEAARMALDACRNCAGDEPHPESALRLTTQAAFRANQWRTKLER